DTLRHQHCLARALVEPGPQLASGRLFGRFIAEVSELGRRELLHRAAAMPSVWREMGVPPWMVRRQHGAVPLSVLLACALVQHSDVTQIGPTLLRRFDALPLTGAVGRAEVHVEDRLETAWAAELCIDDVAGLRILDRPSSPPALLLQGRDQPLLEV